jgi:hypothetical protein
VHGGCDQSAEDAYSSVAPDPISGVTRGCVSLVLNTVDRLFCLPDLDQHTDINHVNCGLFSVPDVIILILTVDCSVTDDQ